MGMEELSARMFEDIHEMRLARQQLAFAATWQARGGRGSGRCLRGVMRGLGWPSQALSHAHQPAGWDKPMGGASNRRRRELRGLL